MNIVWAIYRLDLQWCFSADVCLVVVRFALNSFFFFSFQFIQSHFFSAHCSFNYVLIDFKCRRLSSDGCDDSMLNKLNRFTNVGGSFKINVKSRWKILFEKLLGNQNHFECLQLDNLFEWKIMHFASDVNRRIVIKFKQT